MARRLTAVFVKSVTPGNTRQEIADRGTGLYLVVQPKPSGAKSWAVRYRYLNKPKKLTLGPVLTLTRDEAEPNDIEIGKPITLAADLKPAHDALHKLKQGRDPAADKQRDIAASMNAAVLRATNSVEAIADRFLKQHVEKKKSGLDPAAGRADFQQGDSAALERQQRSRHQEEGRGRTFGGRRQG